MGFTHLSVQSDFSFLTSSIQVGPLVDRIKGLGMEAVALTDHANMFGAMPFLKAAKKAGIKPLLGAQIFVVDQLEFKGARPDALGLAATGRPTPLGQGIFSLTVLAETQEGYRQLCRLLTWAYAHGLQEKPVVSHAVLAEHSQGLLALSGNLRSEVASCLAQGEWEEAKRRVKIYQEIFGERYFLEAQNSGLKLQRTINPLLAQLSQECGIGVVATNDCAYLSREDAPYQKVLMNIGAGRTLQDPDALSFESDEHYVKSEEEMRKAFAEHRNWCDNTQEIMRRCEVVLKAASDAGTPVYHLPAFKKSEETVSIRDKAYEGLERKKVSEDLLPRYRERMELELSVITQMGFEGYFLIVSDFIRWAKNQGIPVGPGRGSGAGSLVSYCLDITGLDPLQHHLLFERFLNPERISMPDFDVDFCQDRRDEVINYVREQYGSDRVAQIITYGKMQAKAVVRDVGRVFAVPHDEIDRFAKLIPFELKMTLSKALEVEPRLQESMDRDPRLKDVMDVALKLEGLHRHAGIHAAGVIIADAPITNYCPLYQSPDGDWMTQFDWISCEDIGLIKFDFLGLKTLTAIENSAQWIRQRHDPKFSIQELPEKDSKTYDLIARGDTVGVFQLESSGMQDLCRRLQPTTFEEITAINALYRPGPLGAGMVDDFINRKKGITPIIYDVPELESILKETYGVVVYQEQVQRIAVTLASYTLGGADLLRRAMGKKKADEMARHRALFIEGAQKNGHDPKIAESIFNQMESFAEYGFNKSHAAAYMMVAYQTAYLKAHYPVEFFAALLSIEMSNMDQITVLIEDARRRGLVMLAPDVNLSSWCFSPHTDNQIRFGLGAVKGVGQGAVEELCREREKNGAFRDLLDVIKRVDTRSVNKRVLEALIKAGAFDFCGIPRARQMAALPDALKQGERFHRSQKQSQSLLFDGDDLTYHHDTFWKQYQSITEWEQTQKLRLEFDTTGGYLSGHPLEKYRAKLELFGVLGFKQLKESAKKSEKVMLAGVVRQCREMRTKKGDKMAVLLLEGLDGTADVVLFPDAFRKHEGIVKSKDPLLVRGEFSEVDAQGRCRVLLGREGSLKSLDQIDVASHAEVHITIEDHRADSIMMYLAEVLKRYPGDCPAFLHIRRHEGEARLRLPNDLRVSLQDTMVSELVDLCGADAVRFVPMG